MCRRKEKSAQGFGFGNLNKEILKPFEEGGGIKLKLVVYYVG